MPYSKNTCSYEGQKYIAADAVRFLHENGFVIDAFEMICIGREVDIKYHRMCEKDLVTHPFKPLSIQEVIQ
jgi:hypothetical protein